MNALTRFSILVSFPFLFLCAASQVGQQGPRRLLYNTSVDVRPPGQINVVVQSAIVETSGSAKVLEVQIAVPEDVEVEATSDEDAPSHRRPLGSDTINVVRLTHDPGQNTMEMHVVRGGTNTTAVTLTFSGTFDEDDDSLFVLPEDLADVGDRRRVRLGVQFHGLTTGFRLENEEP